MDETKQKSGLAVSLCNLITNIQPTNYVHITGLIKQDKETAGQIEEFRNVFETRCLSIFAKAQYALMEKRKRENRKPAALPEKNDLEILRKQLSTEMAKIESINDTREFVRLRKLTMSRLLVLNCRRGSEPTRVTVDDLGGPNSWIWGDQTHG